MGIWIGIYCLVATTLRYCCRPLHRGLLLGVAFLYLLFPADDVSPLFKPFFNNIAAAAVVLELCELLLWQLKLCAFTEIDCYRVISQFWLVFVLALPDSCVLKLYLVVTSGFQFVKYFYGSLHFFSSRLQEWQRCPQTAFPVVGFPLEVCLTCAAALEFVWIAT